MSNEEELIITTKEYPLPPLPMLPSLVTDKIEAVQEDLLDPKISTESKLELLHQLETVSDPLPSPVKESMLMSFWMDSENRSLLIHGLCDIIFFYFAFRYISNCFYKTKHQIDLCKQSIKNLKEQYGFVQEE